MLRKLRGLRVTEPDFMFLATAPESILRVQNFLKRSIEANFCGQNEENICHHVTKLLYRLCIC